MRTVICLFLVAAAATPPITLTKARAAVIVMKPGAISEQLWKAQHLRRERIIVDEEGRLVRLRLIEYE